MVGLGAAAAAPFFLFLRCLPLVVEVVRRFFEATAELTTGRRRRSTTGTGAEGDASAPCSTPRVAGSVLALLARAPSSVATVGVFANSGGTDKSVGRLDGGDDPPAGRATHTPGSNSSSSSTCRLRSGRARVIPCYTETVTVWVMGQNIKYVGARVWGVSASAALSFPSCDCSPRDPPDLSSAAAFVTTV